MRKLQHLPIILFICLSVLSVFRADSDEPPCFMVSVVNCSQLQGGNKCGLLGDKFTDQIFCCNVTHERELVGFISSITSPARISGFHMRDSSLEKLEVKVFDKLKRLTSFSITNSNITHVSGAFEGPSSLACLNISQNVIVEMPPYILLKLKELKNIVMTNNINITMLPEFSKDLRGFRLDVSGNFQLSCKYLINLTLAVAQETMTFTQINRNLTMCSPPLRKVFTDASTVYVTMDHLDKVKEIVYDCPVINKTNKCHCSVYTLDVGENQTFMYQALVNCSHRAMVSLPDKLPSATRVLDISNNNITSFEGIGNRTFNNIRELYADNNKITSLKPLQGTIFLYQFQNLTLRNNKIDQIQLYVLSNVFDRLQGTRILLAKNEFKCECSTASQIKLWLMTNKEHVPDYDDIFTVCGKNRMRVIDLNQKDLCSKPTEWKDFIRFVIYGEIFVFVLLIGKVSYDYYIFKTFGYLPWPASKMPKLPCDWCFET